MLKNSSAIAVAARMTRVSSAQLLETRRPGPNNHKKVTKFPMAALECAQSYLAGQGSAVCSGGVKRARNRRTMYFGPYHNGLDRNIPWCDHAPPLRPWQRTG